MLNVKTVKDNTKKTKDGLLKHIELLCDLLDEQRMIIGYLNFDTEATRRERDFLRKELNKLKK